MKEDRVRVSREAGELYPLLVGIFLSSSGGGEMWDMPWSDSGILRYRGFWGFISCPHRHSRKDRGRKTEYFYRPISLLLLSINFFCFYFYISEWKEKEIVFLHTYIHVSPRVRGVSLQTSCERPEPREPDISKSEWRDSRSVFRADISIV